MQLLSEAGLSADRLALLQGAMDLLEDVTALLGWALEWPVLFVLYARAQGKPAVDLDDETELTALFETQTEDLRRLGQMMLGCLRSKLED
ncbi:MAG: hypothetical protein HC808_18380 [Candidatus Competibacteraceae bacterium]|nr:hypothetical protein [Candidatus Competibacteraceae bacterium]